MKPALAALACLIVGLAAGTILGMELAATPGPVAAEQAPPRPGGTTTAQTPAPQDLVPVNGPRSGPDGGSRPEAARLTDRRAEDLARAALGRAEAPALDSDLSAVLEGKVVDGDGQPLEGVDVVCRNRPASTGRTYRSPAGRRWQGLGSLEDAVAASARRALEDRARLRHAVTGPDGTFRLNGLREGSHPIDAYGEGFTFPSIQARTGEPVTLIGTRLFPYHLDLRLPDGSQPESASVHYTFDYQNGSQSSSYGWTPGDPVLWIASASARLTPVAGAELVEGAYGQLSEYRAVETAVETCASSEPPVRIELAGAQALVVEVTGAPERVGFGSSLDVKYVVGTELADVDWANFHLPELSQVHTPRGATKATFHGTDLAPGTYTLGGR